jgi:hypothetical protein
MAVHLYGVIKWLKRTIKPKEICNVISHLDLDSDLKPVKLIQIQSQVVN